jgi:MFS family permease
MQQHEAAQILTRSARRNFWMNVGDGATFAFGLSMVSRYTVLPLFVSRLNSDPLLLGVLPALFSLGWLLPQLFTAPLVSSLPRRLPFVLKVTIGERLPFLLFGLVLLAWPGLPAWVLLATCFGCYVVHTFCAGVAATAWQDLLARVVPADRWGRLFGMTNALGGGLGVLGALVSGWALTQLPFPQNVGLLSLLCFAALVVSFVFLALVVEPPQPSQPRLAMMLYLRGLLPLLRRDAAFRSDLFSRSAIARALTGQSFITAAALVRLNVSDALVGVYTAVLLGSQAVAHYFLGGLSDRWGHKQVLELSTAVGVASLLLALAAPSAGWFIVVFILVGISSAGYQLSGYTLAMAFSNEAERPTYIGLANTALAPVGIIGPLLVAQLAASFGYPALFATTALVGVVGLIWLHRAVPIRAQQAAAAP